MDREDLRKYVNRYDRLRDVQSAAYELYGRSHGLTVKELFVLDILWSAPEGCLQSEMCARLSATKQTISAIVKKFWKLGYLTLNESETDRRNKVVRLTETGEAYAESVILPAKDAEVDAMSDLPQEDIVELLRLTKNYSRLMLGKFDSIQRKNEREA